MSGLAGQCLEVRLKALKRNLTTNLLLGQGVKQITTNQFSQVLFPSFVWHMAYCWSFNDSESKTPIIPFLQRYAIPPSPKTNMAQFILSPRSIHLSPRIRLFFFFLPIFFSPAFSSSFALFLIFLILSVSSQYMHI